MLAKTISRPAGMEQNATGGGSGEPEARFLYQCVCVSLPAKTIGRLAEGTKMKVMSPESKLSPKGFMHEEFPGSFAKLRTK